jgi:hypothetical protein
MYLEAPLATSPSNNRPAHFPNSADKISTK